MELFPHFRHDPYYTIHPIAVEELYPAPHQILLFHHVLTDVESDRVASLAGDKVLAFMMFFCTPLSIFIQFIFFVLFR